MEELTDEARVLEPSWEGAQTERFGYSRMLVVGLTIVLCLTWIGGGLIYSRWLLPEVTTAHRELRAMTAQYKAVIRQLGVLERQRAQLSRAPSPIGDFVVPGSVQERPNRVVHRPVRTPRPHRSNVRHALRGLDVATTIDPLEGLD